MKNILLIILQFAICLSVSAQITIQFNDSDSDGNYHRLNDIDSLNQLVLNEFISLHNKRNNDEQLLYSNLEGLVFHQFRVENNIPTDTLLIRSIGSPIDSSAYYYSIRAFNILKKYINPINKPYSVYIGFRITRNYNDVDRLYLNKGEFIFEKRGVMLFTLDNYIDRAPIPNTIYEYVTWLNGYFNVDSFRNEPLGYFMYMTSDYSDILYNKLESGNSELIDYFHNLGITEPNLIISVLLENLYYQILEIEFDVEA